MANKLSLDIIYLLKISATAVFLSFLSSNQSISQILPEDASGENSILLEGGSVNFNFTKSELAAHYTGKKHIDTGFDLLYSIKSKAGNSNGIGPLISAGEIQPSSQLSGVIGIGIINNYPLEYKLLDSKKDSLKLALDTIANRINENISDAIKVKMGEDYYSIRRKLIEYFNELGSGDIAEEKTITNRLIESTTDTILDKKIEKNIKKTFSEIDTILQKDFNEHFVEVEINDEKMLKAFPPSSPIHKLTFYTGIDLSSRSFKSVGELDTMNLLNSFKSKTSKVLNFDLGFNYSYNFNWFAGLKIRFSDTDNFSTLKKVDYTITETSNSGSPNTSIKTENKITAYKKQFKEGIGTFSVYLDLMRRQKISGTNFISYGIYWRLNNFAGNNTVPHTKDIGFALNFHTLSNGKFLGGFYIESENYNNGINKLNKKDEDRPFSKSINFGLRAGYVFKSLQK